MVIDTPVTICFVIPQNKQFYKSTRKQLRKSCNDFNVARSTVCIC